MNKRPCSLIRLLAMPLAGLAGIALLATSAFAAGDPPPDRIGLDYITQVRIGTSVCDTCPPRVCPEKPVVISVSGVLPNGCVAFRGLRELPVGAPFTVLAADFVVDTCGVACPTVLTEFSASMELPPALPGVQSFTLISQVRSCPDTNVVARSSSQQFVYEVEPNCFETPPLDSLVRSFVSFRVVPELRCEGDSLTLQLVKNGCPPCVHLESLTNHPIAGYRAVVAWTPLCNEFRCHPETLSVAIGHLRSGSHQLVAGVDVRLLRTPLPDTVISFQERVSFDVARTCDTTQVGCVLPDLFAAEAPFGCAVDVAPGNRGTLILSASSHVPLGGLQGRLECPAPFRVVELLSPYAVPMRDPPGTRGLHVSWVPEGRGARFVLFTTDGTSIPSGSSPVLAVVVACDSGAVAGTRAIMRAPLDVASDPAGRSVPICSFELLRLAGIGLCVGGQALACDVNHDGHSDVRDLVLMTTCLRIDPPGGSDLCPDCNDDGAWAFDDLLCCARHILRLPLVPRDSVRPNDALHVTFDTPQPESGGWLVRVRLSGADALGAALLRLRYPAERWRADIPVFVDQRTGSASEGWLPIIDTEQPGVVQLGGLRLAETVSSELEFLLRFTSLAAAHEADQIVVEGADLAARDGSVLTPAAALPSLPLYAPQSPTSPPGSIELGPARPNPFARTTNFTLSLPREADVEVSILDLAGRRVATLLRGRVAAGLQEVSWDGSNARDGVYFVKLVVDGRIYSRRVALMRDGR